MRMYGIKNCNSVKKAKCFLESHQLQYDFVDFKKTPPSVEKITHWFKQKGSDVVINSKGTTYKKLDLKNKNLSQKELIDFCVEYPSLIKRPVLEHKDILMFGFDENAYKEIVQE